MNPLTVSRARGFRCPRLNEIARQIAEEDGTPGLAQMFPVEPEPLPGEMPWWRKPKEFRERCLLWCRNHNARLIECDPVSMDMTFSRDEKIWTRKMEVEPCPAI